MTDLTNNNLTTNGRSSRTGVRFSPASGVMMGGRSGHFDPGVA
ncbi:hypothetical protein [Dyadobacter bucti]